jgi:hypothetical protein
LLSWLCKKQQQQQQHRLFQYPFLFYTTLFIIS